MRSHHHMCPVILMDELTICRSVDLNHQNLIWPSLGTGAWAGWQLLVEPQCCGTRRTWDGIPTTVRTGMDHFHILRQMSLMVDCWKALPFSRLPDHVEGAHLQLRKFEYRLEISRIQRGICLLSSTTSNATCLNPLRLRRRKLRMARKTLAFCRGVGPDDGILGSYMLRNHILV